jgi:hypothetical protein
MELVFKSAFFGVAKRRALPQKPGEQRGLIQAAPYLFDLFRPWRHRWLILT